MEAGTAESSSHEQGAENAWGWGWAFGTSKLISSDSPLPMRPHCLIPPNSSTNWGPSIHTYEPLFVCVCVCVCVCVHTCPHGCAILIQTTTARDSGLPRLVHLYGLTPWAFRVLISITWGVGGEDDVTPVYDEMKSGLQCSSLRSIS
jgi:hypothetical protein